MFINAGGCEAEVPTKRRQKLLCSASVKHLNGPGVFELGIIYNKEGGELCEVNDTHRNQIAGQTYVTLHSHNVHESKKTNSRAEMINEKKEMRTCREEKLKICQIVTV